MPISAVAIALIAATSFNSTAVHVDSDAISTFQNRLPSHTLTVNELVPEEARRRKAWITAYASVPEQTDDTPFITANGTHVRDGIIATNFLPFGTKIKIPSLFGDKVFVVEDRMAPRFKNSVDIWMPSVEATDNFGAHYAEILILKSAPASIALVPTPAKE